MTYATDYEELELTRDEVRRMRGAVVLEFGASWCGICQGFAPKFEALLEDYPDVRHVKVADGKGKPLGRSFRVTLWPTLVFLREGEVVRQFARPDVNQAREGLEAISGKGAPEEGERGRADL